MTGPVEQIRVECPGCGRCYEDWTGGSGNLELDPELGDPGYVASCCTADCPHCGCSAHLGRLVVEGGIWRSA